jgi:gentisate 1,2-dioxygenase
VTGAAAAVIDMADLPVQQSAAPATPAQRRARFFNSGNAFNVKLSPVAPRTFTGEAAAALAPAAPTGFYPCDQSADLGCDFPATTPLMLARYARIAPRETLAADFAATGSIWYVISGGGESGCGAERIAWSAGDIFLLPGGTASSHRAGLEGAVLWTVSNEPQLAFEHLCPPGAAQAAAEPVHYPAAEIERQFGRLFQASSNEATSGFALIFSSERQQASRNILPTLTLSFNTLPAGEKQRAHLHNSAAVTLIVRGGDCHSLVDGAACRWTQWATMVTPPGAPHSHHNGGTERAYFLIVQDGGLYYHARTMGFEFLE